MFSLDIIYLGLIWMFFSTELRWEHYTFGCIYVLIVMISKQEKQGEIGESILYFVFD